MANNYFNKYDWCDPIFVCGFARVVKNDKWGIIDTLGNIIVPLEYDKIWTIKEQYIFSIKAFVGEEEKVINLDKLATNVILEGLKYIQTYSIDELNPYLIVLGYSSGNTLNQINYFLLMVVM
ncbi:MAG: WG repeat-containing protein [Bacteroides sp.]|nr:WG repeat-containing protein [Bacteroides sp.]